MTWRSFKLNELATIRSGGGAPQDSSAFSETGFPFIRAGSLPKLVAGGDEAKLERIERATATKYKLDLFPAGTVFFAKSGMSATKGHIYQTKVPAYAVNHLAAIVPNNETDGRFLVHALQVNSPVRLIRDQAYPSIRLGDIAAMEIEAPTDAAKRAEIAAILDKANALRQKRKQAIALLDSLTQSIFLEMFGDLTRNTKGWSLTTLESICERITVGIVVKPSSYYREHGVPALRSLNVGINTLNLNDLVHISSADNENKLKKSKLTAGDVVIVRTGQPGKAAVVPKELDGANAIDLLIATPNTAKLNPQFLCTLMNSDMGKRMVMSEQRGQIQQHFNVGSLKAAEVPIPPMSEQLRFVDILQRLHQTKSASELSMTENEALFSSLQHRAFSGQL